MRIIEVVDYQADWPDKYQQEQQRILQALSNQKLQAQVHHIGSTSVPGLAAKPVIDMLLEVHDVTALDPLQSCFEALGYEALGEFEIPGRRYYRKGGDARSHQIHAFARGSEGWRRHLAFRDYLRAHDTVRDAYAEVKRAAAARCAHNIETYMDLKDGFIQQAESDALGWWTAPKD